jgi:hypothetical protein
MNRGRAGDSLAAARPLAGKIRAARSPQPTIKTPASSDATTFDMRTSVIERDHGERPL